MGKKLEKKIMASKTRKKNLSLAIYVKDEQQNYQSESYNHTKGQNIRKLNTGQSKSERSLYNQNFYSANKILKSIFFNIESELRSIYESHQNTDTQLIKNDLNKYNSYSTKQLSIRLKFKKQGGRKICFNFGQKQNKTNKKGINSENFLGFLDKEEPIFIQRIDNSEFVFYKDFADAIDQFVNRFFIKYPGFNKKLFFRSYYQIMTTEIQKFKEQKKKNFDFLICNWTQFKQKTDFYPKYQLRPRLFNSLKKYISVLQNTKFNVNKIYDIKNILKSDLKPNCEQKCSCNMNSITLETFSECQLHDSTWKSKCCDKNQRLECSTNCGCNENCKNRALQSFDPNSDLKNFRIQLVWGIDFYTRKNIQYLLPQNLTQDIKDQIIDKIIRYMNFIGYEGWNITNILCKMVQECERRLNETLSKKDSNKCTKKKSSKKNSKKTIKSRSLQSLKSKNESSIMIIKHHPYLNKAYQYDQKFSKIDSNYNQTIYDSTGPKKSKRRKSKKSILKEKNNQKQISNIEEDFFQYTIEGLALEDELKAYQSLYQHTLIKQLRQGLRIHSKGLGVICIDQKGIKKNQLISIYQGEVYPSWYWSIKQQVIKSFLNGVKKDKYKQFKEYKNNYNIDFYNIQVEKHKEEPKGREIFVIDPIINGNFVSRLSHSCDPNCWAIPVISNGQYSIAMYAIKNIDYHEELTFDYCSFTENEKEYLNSICLCGKKNCKAYYLGYSKKHQIFFNEEIKQNLIDYPKTLFINSNFLIMKSTHEKLTKQIKQCLKLNSFGQNTFKNSPDWIKIWSYYCLQAIENEKNYLLNKVQTIKLKPNPYQDQKKCIQLEIENLYFQRIHNLIITIDKIRNFCQNQKKELQNKPPLQLLTTKEIINHFKLQLKNFANCKLIKDNQELLELIQDIINDNNIQKYFKQYFKNLQCNLNVKNLLVIKIAFLELSNYYKEFSKLNTKFNYEIFSDILFFHAFTIVNFRLVEYSSFEVDVKIRNCDLSSPSKALIKCQKNKKEQIKKLEEVLITIPNNFLWKQLIFWSNHTTEKQENSLSSWKQGIFSYPSISDFIEQKNNRQCKKKYSIQTDRVKWLEKVLCGDIRPWNNIHGFQFKKNQKQVKKNIWYNLI